MGSRFQVIWWREDWWKLWWSCWKATGSLRFIYRWSWSFGPLEIRRWEPRTVDEIRASEPTGESE